jgi:signal peptidase II
MEDASARQSVRPPRVRLAVRRRDGWFLLLAASVVGLDQLAKWFVREAVDRGEAWPSPEWPLRVVHVTNTGAAFGILQDAGPLLAVTSLIGMTAILIYLFNPGFAHPLMRAGLALMLGGAVGNLVDRVANGEVVDFIKVSHWPAFNVADSCITIGVLLLLWTMTRVAPEPSNTES